MQHQLVKIVWQDAFAAPQGWTFLEDYKPEAAYPVTVGWLLPDVIDGYVTTADTILVQGDEISYYNVGHIPVDMVKSIEVLENPDKLSKRLSKKKGK